MPRSPLTLAALATVAVPGLDAFDARPSGQTGGDVDAAVVLGADGRRWVVRAPRTPTAGAALEAEVVLLEALVRHVDDGRLPFDVPRPAGFAHLPEGGRAMVHPLLPGRPLPLERLGPGPGLAADVGRAVAALHELPPSTVEDAGLPVYEAEAYRRRRLSEVDEAARTGRVPGGLLRRWEHALEDVATWRFRPTVVHGDLSAEHVLHAGDRLTAVLGWSEAKVADPADDLAWLLVAAPQEAVDPILEAYHQRRTELRDPHLAERALLAGELALARWLLHGVRVDDPEIVDDATAMLVELDEHTSVEEPPVVAGWAATADGPEADGPVRGEPQPTEDEAVAGDEAGSEGGVGSEDEVGSGEEPGAEDEVGSGEEPGSGDVAGSERIADRGESHGEATVAAEVPDVVEDLGDGDRRPRH
ncbi:phosphotransferase [Cellulomonas carbonis]|uniref:Aminoglycoside phosphotransferase n=1 Tax=Cellulomonas carbonis T26 TaxID=947969 RepID=A0A0A0BXX3_9CELL|nr:phosphotransferase [Cellulomonas carbonis]KGM12805.1 aminoglycoside phosphotransferase [Cellulomonas carbonis T26]GGC14818.1 hypothetical protein GCM10010972_30100 [Cellulomonas carbonis]